MSSNEGNQLDWQGGISAIQDRMKYLLDTGLESDVQFLVGTGNKLPEGNEEKQLIKAHKFVLSMSSSIFAAQFRFNEASEHGENAPIEITDANIKATAFVALLHFVYSNDLSLIKKENFVGVYVAAKKYLLYALVQKCIEMAETMLEAENVFPMLRMAKLHEEENMEAHCWAFIDQNISYLIHGQKTDSLSYEEMDELLARDTLDSDLEDCLFNCLDRWAAKQCEMKEINEPTGEQKRAEMGTLLNLIRFPLIDAMNFINDIVPKGILINGEIVAILINFCEDSEENVTAMHPMLFSAQPRANSPIEHNKLVLKSLAEEEKADLIEEMQKQNKQLKEQCEAMRKFAKELRSRLRTANEKLAKYGHNGV